ncbi:MAG TPA: preprotein translocase subunit SecG, partial [Kofleriaceae bacterium]|nr:preprotein translocase subunit SecG [Kofleriaceae bacterium]
MSTLVTILHVAVCLFLMLTVLLQEGKSGMGGAFGGSSAGTVFGGAGASSFLRRLTAAAATIFMITSIILAYIASRDAGEPLERYSKAEAARLKQKKEAEKKGLQGALDAGVGDGGVAPLTLDLGGDTATPG